MSSRSFRLQFLLIAFMLKASVFAADQKTAPDMSLFDWLGFAQGLEVNPKLIAPTDGNDPTVGLQYKYDRHITGGGLHNATDVELRIHSEGILVPHRANTPNRLLTHGIRFSAINLLPQHPSSDLDRFQQVSNLQYEIRYKYFQPWRRDLNRIKQLKQLPAPNDAEKQELAEKSKGLSEYVMDAGPLLREYGTIEVDESLDKWRLRDAGNRLNDWSDYLMDNVIRRRWLFLSFDLDADAETDQAFSDIQLVGSGQLRGKMLLPILDYPFRILREKGGPPKNWLNRDGGPHFFAGVAAVDASGNDSRKDITTEHQHFTRAHAGISYRTEVFSTSESAFVALELAWRYYYEFNAPAAIRSRKLDDTSYFKATLLFPGNYFLEYTDGKLPIDVEGASTVSVGWRYNF